MVWTFFLAFFYCWQCGFLLRYIISEMIIFCLFVLRFYGPVNPCRARSVYLTTRLGLVLLAVNQYCAHSFARNRQLPFLNQRKGENDRRKYFMINLHERMWPTSAGVEPATSRSPVGRRIQLSHRGRLWDDKGMRLATLHVTRDVE